MYENEQGVLESVVFQDPGTGGWFWYDEEWRAHGPYPDRGSAQLLAESHARKINSEQCVEVLPF